MPGHVLVIESAAPDRIFLRAVLTEAHYAVTVADSRHTALKSLTENRPSLILLSDRIDSTTDATMLDALRRAAAPNTIPTIVLTRAPSAAKRIAALTAGADEIMEYPVSEATLLARMRSLLRAYETETALLERQQAISDLGFAEAQSPFLPPSRVAVVSNDPERAQLWCDALRAHPPYPLHPIRPEDALATAHGEATYDLFLIDAAGGAPGTGLRLLSELRSRQPSRYASFVLVHDPEDPDSAVMALDLGANDLIAAGFDPAELALRLSIQLGRKHQADRMRKDTEEGLRLATIDELTGLHNRRYAMACLGHLSRRATKTGRPFALLIGDLDLFKRINDTYGHPAGDHVLREVAARLRENMRASDVLARMGGEEFLIAMPDTSADVARLTADRLCARVSHKLVSLSDGNKVPVTMSIGVATGKPGETLAAVMERADKALYASKSAGRNRASFSPAV